MTDENAPSHGWNIPYSGPENEPNRVNQLQHRVTKIEEWATNSDGHDRLNALIEKVKDLEIRMQTEINSKMTEAANQDG
jgi:hypothetical protein